MTIPQRIGLKQDDASEEYAKLLAEQAEALRQAEFMQSFPFSVLSPWLYLLALIGAVALAYFSHLESNTDFENYMRQCVPEKTEARCLELWRWK